MPAERRCVESGVPPSNAQTAAVEKWSYDESMRRHMLVRHRSGQPASHPNQELTPENWEKIWTAEIRLRLADYRAGKAKKVDLGGLLQELRDSARAVD